MPGQDGADGPESGGDQKEVRVMLYLKSCPRCKGDIYVNRDMYGDYKECLQCGLTQEIDKPDEFASVQRAAPRKKRAA